MKTLGSIPLTMRSLEPFLWIPTTVLAALTLLWPLWSLAQEPAGASVGVLVDRIVATVSDTPISASEVAFEDAVRERILTSGNKQAFGRLLTEPGEALEATIFRAILLQQPGTAEIELKDRALAEERARIFETSFESTEPYNGFLRRWGIGHEDLVRFFHTYARLDTMIELSVDPKVSDEEERSYYQRNKDQVFGGKEFVEVSDMVSRQVYLLKFEVEYNAWRSRLRARASKRYIGR
jgi:hypothetical protein